MAIHAHFNVHVDFSFGLEVFATAFASVFAWFNNVGAFMIDSIASFGSVWCGVVMLRSAGATDPNERLRDKQRDV